jgi:outer membrane protein TolC
MAAQSGVAGVTGVGSAGAAPAAQAISLDEALRLAEANSEQVTIARAGVLRARGQQLQARSALFPQLAATAGYTRTLASQFSSFTSVVDTTAPQNCPTGRFQPDTTAPLGQRLGSVEHALACGGGNPFAAFKNVGFGALNQVNLGLTGSMNLFTGGRVTGLIAEAAAARAVADIGLSSTRAQLMLDVTQAYYDAALADRLLNIAQGTLTQARQTLEQVRLARQVGNQPEFDLLRAQVSYENQQPVVIQRRAQRDIALLRLKQLLNLPSTEPVSLTTALGDTAAPAPVAHFAASLVRNPGDTATAGRAPVRQAAQALRAQAAGVKVARSERFPSLALVSQYGRVAYPLNGMPVWTDFRTNWTVAVSLSVPLFTGGRITGDQLVAEAALLEARARLEQTSELAALDTRSAEEQLTAAAAAYNASAGTAQQASRAYSIAEVRYREGISTQLELDDSRLMLEQSAANRAQAARDLQVARIRMLLLPELPLGASSATTNASSAGQTGSAGGQSTQAAPAQPTPTPTPTTPTQPLQVPGGTTTVSASTAPVNP